MDKIYKKYQGHKIENWFSETSPDFKKFASYVKRRMKIAAADRGIVLEGFIVGTDLENYLDEIVRLGF